MKIEALSILIGRRVPQIKENLLAIEDLNERLEFIKSNVDEEALNWALFEMYKEENISLDEISANFNISDNDFLKALAARLKFDFIDLDNVDVDYRIIEKLQYNMLKNTGIIPFKEDEINVYIAYLRPFSFDDQEQAQHLFNRKLVKNFVANPAQIERILRKIEQNETIKDLVAEIRRELNSDPTLANDADNNSSGILKLIETILRTCIVSRVSDIHIEPTEVNCVVRGRIDGMLAEIFIFDKDIYPPMVSRMKLLSNMDIAERRKPQDGRFSATVNNVEYDFRISTLPIINGESIVLRILDKSKVVISLDKLGMHPVNLERFKAAMHAPYGIILVTGPTGSGKTTTLYAALNDMKSVETKIITVEDPVEYQLNLIQQVHVNEKAGLTFAAALRSILRQDPDIIMIGEIRDAETLRIAIQAALTGHLVFSTLHTNDAVSAVTRIADMGVEPYMISGALTAIEAQRLIRKLCPNCKKPAVLSKDFLEKIEKYTKEVENFQFYKPVGCHKCSQTGYAGREMISEILPISDRLSSMVAAGASKDEIRTVAYEEGFVDMYHDGIVRAARGITSIDEVLRVAKE
ncbi:Flp pilus assembly complex ATPase component TadA [Campylobacter canadensis]|uniref:GspE/PulE family protein n=1 Tax=Campylobacter canadensis TaxID=449520 RepID=UPI001555DE48|nr:ATPase, T2SS/T4P/T4SS family [Campylobacter canadensis]MBZ7994794.1 Flp pilus assembly complex ATPase component TadA [Campylobacter canadensis]MBZ7996498.1 Flp pilus assembly complex ATPase component TadA [Campylobacter canadensis]MBZ8000221.1 Flp pilus assembly complex ATPase component TadA [Campylobacter canadensis]MBZ8001823.1 Flp pilus assembly complex ATPase component TadA [Campylobacter canadensis]MBZ8004113.1 Flp pilus assembly complex ATPase component TadA [Campylobacter canadensis]